MNTLIALLLSCSLWAKTESKSLTELSLPSLYASNRSSSIIRAGDRKSNRLQTEFTYAFLELLAVAKERGTTLEPWFREAHFIYFADYLREQEKEEAIHLFGRIRDKIQAGSTEIRSILSDVGSPILIARMARLDSEVLHLKDLHKDVIRLAIAKHETENGQMYGKNEYSYHLRQVRSVLKRFGFGPKDSLFGLKIGTAAWLHDIIEDTDVTLEQVRELYGEEISTTVLGVTKIDTDNIRGAEKLRLTYERTRLHRGSRILKLADRIANVEEGLMLLFSGQKSKVHKYFEEWRLFSELIYVPGDADLMWRHLELLLTDQSYAQEFILKSVREDDGVRPTSLCISLLATD